MKRFKIILTIRYQDAERKRSGIQPAKDFTHATRKLADLVAWQTETDAETHGEPVTVNLYIREVKAKAKTTKRKAQS